MYPQIIFTNLCKMNNLTKGKVRGLYQICSIYKVNNLRAYLQNDVLRAIDVEARWEYDVCRAAEGTGYINK